MEKQVKIETPDGKIIYGILNGSLKDPLIFIVHGLSGHVQETLHHNAVSFFISRGFSVFRISLYSHLVGARKLHETTLEIHGRDIDLALKYLCSQGSTTIFMVGHSYGFPSILCSHDRSFKAVVAWDGSLLPHEHFKNLARCEKPDGYILDEGYFVIMGKEMYEEANTLSTEALLKNLGRPLKFIAASDEKESNREEGVKIIKMAEGSNLYSVVPGTTHCFTEEGVLDTLYQETLSWFQLHS